MTKLSQLVCALERNGENMDINTYDLVLDNETKHCSLKLKESLPYKGEYLSEPSQVAEMIREIFHADEMADEFVYLIAFNGGMKVLGVFEIGHGTVNACLLDARGIFMRAIYTGATCVVIAHTHPSGDTAPSRLNRETTAKIRDTRELIGIPLMDHIIVSSTGYTSFHTMGLL